MVGQEVSAHCGTRQRLVPKTKRNGRILPPLRADNSEEEVNPLLQPLLDELFEEDDLREQLVELPLMFTGEKEGETFDIDRWNTHRSSSRYVRLLFGAFSSVTTRRILPPLFVLVAWSAAIDLYNSVEQVYGLPELELPLTPFELTTPILGLLLVFRSDRAFDRFSLGSDYSWEITNLFKSVIREILSFTAGPRFSTEERAAAYELVEACVLLHGWIMKDHLRGRQIQPLKQEAILQLALGVNPKPREGGLLTPSSVKSAISRRVLRPSGAVHATTHGSDPGDGWPHEPLAPSSGIAAVSLGMNRRLPSLDFQESTLLESQLSDVLSAVGRCEMMLRTPLPLGYTRYSVRFLWIWLSLLPFALVNKFAEFGTGTWWEDKPQPVLVVAMLFIGFIFSSIEDIAVQIEEPFGVLPLELHRGWLARERDQVERMHRYADGMRGDDGLETGDSKRAGPQEERWTGMEEERETVNGTTKRPRKRSFRKRLGM